MPASPNPNDDAPHMTGRRTALQALAALSTGWLASLNNPDTTVAKKKRKAKAGPPGPAGPQGPQGPAGPSGSALTTRVVFSPLSSPLSLALETDAEAIADCGGEGRVLSCGYQISNTSAQLANAIVRAVEPNSTRATCNAFLARTAGDGSVVGAQIQAIAICLD